MSYEYQVTLSWDSSGNNGTPDTSVTLHDYNDEYLLLADGFSKTETLHKDLKPVQDKASFNVKFRTSLANTLLTLDPDIRVFVDIDQLVSTTAVDWFYGTIRPITKWNVTGEDDSVIQMEAIDNSDRLKRKLTSAYKETSITVSTVITELLILAGYSASEYNIPTISDTVDYILEKRNENTYWDVIKDILFSYGYVFYFDESGVFQTYDYSVSSTPSIAGIITDSEMVDSIDVERNIEDYDGVYFKWYDTLTAQDYPLISRNRVTFLTFGNEQTYPEITSDNPDAPIHSFSFKDDKDKESITNIVDYSDIKLQYEINQLEYVGRIKYHTFNYTNISPGYTSTTGPYTYTGLVQFTLDDSDAAYIQFKYDRYNLIDPSTQWVQLVLTAYRVVGDVTYTVEREFHTNTSASNPLTIKGKYVYSVDTAKRTANILERRLSSSQYIYTLRSEDEYNNGDYVTLQSTDLNINTTARVIKRKIVESRRAKDGNIIREYELEGVGELGTLFGQVGAGVGTVSVTSAAVANAANTSKGLNPEGNVVKTIKGFVIDQDDSPNESGLYMTRNYLGFWDLDTNEWVARIQNDGGVGKAHFGGAADNYLDWDGTNLSIKGAASISGTLDVGDTLTVDGDITMSSGTLSGTGFTLDASGLDLTAGTINIGSGVFTVAADGSLVATSATITGTITADTGAIGGWDVTATALDASDDSVSIRSDLRRMEIRDALDVTKVAVGYLSGIADYEATDFGLYIGPGASVGFSSGASFEDGDYLIDSDAAFIAESGGIEAVRLGGLGSGDIGLDIGGMKFGPVLGGGGATGAFEATVTGGGGATGTFDAFTTGGGGARYGTTAGLLYSLADDRLYLTGTLVGVDGVFSGSLSAVTGTFQGDLTAATITGGNIVVESTGAIQSSNYVSGSGGSGWRIDGTSVEIDDGTFRGTLSAVTGTLGSLNVIDDIEVSSSGKIRAGYDASGNAPASGAGFYLGSDGTFKARDVNIGGEFSNVSSVGDVGISIIDGEIRFHGDVLYGSGRGIIKAATSTGPLSLQNASLFGGIRLDHGDPAVSVVWQANKWYTLANGDLGKEANPWHDIYLDGGVYAGIQQGTNELTYLTQSGPLSTSSTSYVTAHTFPKIIFSGTIKMSVLHQVSVNGYVRFLKNGSQLAAWSLAGGSATRTLNVSVSFGDVLSVQHLVGLSNYTSTLSAIKLLHANDGDALVALWEKAFS